MTQPGIYYFDHSRPQSNPSPPYSAGEAGFIWLDHDEFIEADWRFEISPNSLHALRGHGVVALLNELDLILGPVGAGQEAAISPGCTEKAMHIFYEADRMTYGSVHDFRVAELDGVEYRLLIDNREYQRTLSRLQFLSSTASREGCGLHLRF
ncbi:MAG: hypothetical protein OSB70_04720 [Myxococcota bacterium]|nr:hypothetical protein [Myxococcota bacterium]